MKIPKAKKLPSGQWRVQLQIGGERISITRAKEKDCLNEAKLIKAQYANGIKPKVTGKNLTLDEAMEIYIEDHRNVLSPTTIRGYGIIRRNRFQSVINKKLKDIDDWQAVINREAKDISAKTLANAWRFTSSVIRYQKLTPPKVALPQISSSTREWLDYEEIKTFMAAIKGSYYEMPCLLALSSLRRSEIFGLHWEDVDLKHETIQIHQTMVPDEDHHYVLREATKNATSRRTVPIMIPRLLELLKEKQGSGQMFRTNPEGCNRRIGDLAEAAGLPRVSLHGLRHSFASLAYHVGMDERTCMELGGWANPATMQKIYTHVAAKDKEAHKNALKKFFEDAEKKEEPQKNAHENAHAESNVQ